MRTNNRGTLTLAGVRVESPDGGRVLVPWGWLDAMGHAAAPTAAARERWPWLPKRIPLRTDCRVHVPRLLAIRATVREFRSGNLRRVFTFVPGCAERAVARMIILLWIMGALNLGIGYYFPRWFEPQLAEEARASFRTAMGESIMTTERAVTLVVFVGLVLPGAGLIALAVNRRQLRIVGLDADARGVRITSFDGTEERQSWSGMDKRHWMRKRAAALPKNDGSTLRAAVYTVFRGAEIVFHGAALRATIQKRNRELARAIVLVPAGMILLGALVVVGCGIHDRLSNQGGGADEWAAIFAILGVLGATAFGILLLAIVSERGWKRGVARTLSTVVRGGRRTGRATNNA